MFYWFIVFVLSFVVSLAIGTFKDRKRYMLVYNDTVSFFSTISELKEYLGKSSLSTRNYTVYVYDVKGYVYISNDLF